MTTTQSKASDYIEITQLKHRYCYTIDRGKYEKWLSLFTADGAFRRNDSASWEGIGSLQTFIDDEIQTREIRTAHFVFNPVIDIAEDEGTGRWYLYCIIEEPDGRTGWIQGRYEDTFRREDGQWYIESVTVYSTKTGRYPEREDGDGFDV